MTDELYDAYERHYLDPPPDVVERRQQRADEAKAAGFVVDASMEATLRVELEHPDVFDRLPGEMKIGAAYYAERKAAAARVNARHQEDTSHD